MKNKLTFIIADDSAIDKFLNAKIVSELDHTVLALANDGIELIELTHKHQPDFILTDTVMPKKDGISACAIIKEKYPSIKCICTTSFNEVAVLGQIKKSYFEGYILKGFSAHKLNSAIDKILLNKKYLDPLLRDNLYKYLGPIKSELMELSELSGFSELIELSEISNYEMVMHNGSAIKITDRHILLVSAIYHSLKRHQIADLMCISEDTVDQNIKRLKSKLSLESRIELVKQFTEWGLIKPIPLK